MESMGLGLAIGVRFLESKLLLLLLLLLLCASLSFAAQPLLDSTSTAVCPTESLFNYVFKFRDWYCPLEDPFRFIYPVAVTEGDEVSLQRALNMVHRNIHEYVAVLFYASWCPFSKSLKPTFSIMPSLYPSTPHFAIEESAVRPSILSKYGVHGFPTLFVLNSTMRVRYHGSRSLGSLFQFYNDVTGAKTIISMDQTSLEEIWQMSRHDKFGSTEQESCPFSWAKSPENLLGQEMYLALATSFVLLRLLYYFFPTLLACVHWGWRRFIQHWRLRSLLEHPSVYLKRLLQSFCSLKEPCKRSNLQGGAMNARTWASKSLATVSIGDASSSLAMQPLSGKHH